MNRKDVMTISMTLSTTIWNLLKTVKLKSVKLKTVKPLGTWQICNPRPPGRRGPVLLVALALVAVLAIPASPASAERPKKEDFELLNPLLNPELSQWMVGPISWIATEKEIEEYLLLVSDEQAEKFIEEFWARRDPYPQRPDNPARKLFEERMADAEAEYQEAGLPGWKTPRGRVFVTYGEPEEVDYEVAQDPRDPLIEVWIYDKKAEKGLDGEKPKRQYRFIKRGELTEFYERLDAFERRRRRATEPPHLRRRP